ncbi:Uncharacterised protein [Moraxella caprae]|uniref:Uncharacterized protein n=1 Tax=Moraxella caprae TaxID=90240 RepID=A0A378QW36_9GAMM|nr:hypothetical protein [Moraxella caprae]STZ07125.1 Uncharacterised protein [Moraxella caprae]
MNGFWENHYQNSIFSSNDKHFDLFRGLCLFGSLLVFPSIYIRVGVILTVLFIILTALLVFGLLKYLGEDVENAIKFFLLTAFVMLVFFAFTILADALKFIYILCTIFFLFVQDWCYRIGHRIFSDNDFNDFIADNVFSEFNRLPAKLGFPFAPSLLRGGGKPLWFDKLTTNGFPYFWVLQEV